MKDIARRLGVGVVGAGGANITASCHLPAMRDVPEVQLRVVCDINEEGVRRTAQQYGVDWTTSYEEMLARKDVDMVQICTPDPFHCQQTILAARAGKHILCQKPIALSLGELKQMRQAVNESGVYFQSVQNARWTARNLRLKTLIDERAIGDVVHVQITRSDKGRPFAYPQSSLYRRPESRYNLFVHEGIHLVDLAAWLMGSLPVEVYGQSRGHYPTEDRLPCDNYHVASILFENGRFALIEHNRLMIQPEGLPPRDRVLVIGTKGHIIADDREGFSVETFSGGRMSLETPTNTDVIASFARLIGDFARRILSGRPPDIPLEHSARILAACILTVESAQKGAPLPVPRP